MQTKSRLDVQGSLLRIKKLSDLQPVISETTDEAISELKGLKYPIVGGIASPRYNNKNKYGDTATAAACGGRLKFQPNNPVKPVSVPIPNKSDLSDDFLNTEVISQNEDLDSNVTLPSKVLDSCDISANKVFDTSDVSQNGNLKASDISRNESTSTLTAATDGNCICEIEENEEKENDKYRNSSSFVVYPSLLADFNDDEEKCAENGNYDDEEEEEDGSSANNVSSLPDKDPFAELDGVNSNGFDTSQLTGLNEFDTSQLTGVNDFDTSNLTGGLVTSFDTSKLTGINGFDNDTSQSRRVRKTSSTTRTKTGQLEEEKHIPIPKYESDDSDIESDTHLKSGYIESDIIKKHQDNDENMKRSEQLSSDSGYIEPIEFLSSSRTSITNPNDRKQSLNSDISNSNSPNYAVEDLSSSDSANPSPRFGTGSLVSENQGEQSRLGVSSGPLNQQVESRINDNDDAGQPRKPRLGEEPRFQQDEQETDQTTTNRVDSPFKRVQPKVMLPPPRLNSYTDDLLAPLPKV